MEVLIPGVTSAAVTTALIAVSWFLFRNRLTKAVQFEFDGKLERLKSDLERSQSQLEALRSGALTLAVTQQTVLNERRLQAVDELWLAVTKVSSLKSGSSMLASLNVSKASKLAAQDEKFAQLMGAFQGSIDNAKGHGEIALRARPYVSPMAWALYSAYSVILTTAALKIQMMQLGMDLPGLIKDSAIRNLVAEALPHHAEFAKTQEVETFHILLAELETALLSELQRTNWVSDDKATLDRASRILQIAEEAQRQKSGDGGMEP